MKPDIFIDNNNHIPIYEQIKNQVVGLIETGQIKTGDQLPTIRELAVELSVNINTVALSYRDLVNAGVIITKRGKGTFVASTPGEEEMKTIRQEKLAHLVSTLIRETDRLGYSREEVGRALVEQFRR